MSGPDVLEEMAAQRLAERRVIRFCGSPPAPRTWDEIVSMLSGVSSPSRSDLDPADEEAVRKASHALGEMYRSGSMNRECASDPRFDLYVPAK